VRRFSRAEVFGARPKDPGSVDKSGIHKYSQRSEIADDSAVGSPRAQAQGAQRKDARPGRFASAPWCLYPRLHDHPEEAELGASQSLSRALDLRRRSHRLHPGRRSQPPGTLDRARAWRSCQRLAWRPVQGHPRDIGRGRRRRSSPSQVPLRIEEGLEAPHA